MGALPAGAAPGHGAEGGMSYSLGLLFTVLLVLVTAHGVHYHHLKTSGSRSSSNSAAVFSQGCSPHQVLLSLGKDASEMHLSWKTAAENCPSTVLFQQLDDNAGRNQPPLSTGMANTARSVGYSYLLSERDMCDDPAASNRFEWNLHRATLRELVPSASYRYRIDGGDHHYYFKAPPAPSADSAFTFVGFGDMGDAAHPEAKSPGAASTLLRLRREVEARKHPAELILHVGDLSYANGDPDIWDSFFEGLQPFASQVPYMVTCGNHEYGYTARRKGLPDPSGVSAPYQPSWGNFGPDSRGECGSVTARRFHMPSYKARRDNAPFWYSFDYGSVHFTTISTEHALAPGSRQYEWLAADLAAVDRCVTPWLVVLLHRPMYVVYPHKSNREVGEHIRAQIEPLLLDHKVDLTIAGHVHTYYRSCVVRDERCMDDDNNYSSRAAAARAGLANGTAAAAAPAAAQGKPSSSSSVGDDPTSTPATNRHHGITHFVIGSAGRKLSGADEDQAYWCAASVQEWGFGRFTVRGSRSLLAEYISSETGEVLDSVDVSSAVGTSACQPGIAVSKH